MANNIFLDACSPAAIEDVATGTVRPGALVAQSAAGIGESSLAANVRGTQVLFADRDINGAGTVNDAYAAGENVIARKLPADALGNVLVAAGQDITRRGVGLSSNGDGTLKIAATTDAAGEIIVAYSDEIINTGGAATLVRVKGA